MGCHGSIGRENAEKGRSFRSEMPCQASVQCLAVYHRHALVHGAWPIPSLVSWTRFTPEAQDKGPVEEEHEVRKRTGRGTHAGSRHLLTARARGRPDAPALRVRTVAALDVVGHCRDKKQSGRGAPRLVRLGFG